MNAISCNDIKHHTGLQVLIIALVTLACLAPFVTKAFHIDDILFLWAAEHIQSQPVDFYDFTVNWNGSDRLMSSFNQNPPLVSYFIALVSLLFGWEELVLHLAFLIPALGLSLGTYFLARQLCAMPLMATLLAILTPAFIVSGTSVMTDTTMIAFYVWAVALWVSGLKNNKTCYLFISCVLIAISTLSKYYGITLVPLLLLYTLVEKRRFVPQILFLSIPIIVLLGYHWLTSSLFGHSLLSNAVQFSIQSSAKKNIPLLQKSMIGLSFTGGCLAVVAFYSFVLWARRFWAVGLLVLVLIAFILSLSMDQAGPNSAEPMQWLLIIQLAICITAGLQILLLASADLLHNRDAASLLLFFWVFGTFIFASYVNWLTNARVVYPMIPAVGILVARRLSYREKSAKQRAIWPKALPLIPAACIALSVAWADFTFANCQRSAAYMIHQEYKDHAHSIWFQGHWGFQYYMESYGYKPLNFKNSVVKKRDLIIIPLNNYNLRKIPDGRFLLRKKFQLPPNPWITVLSKKIGAGFYTSNQGWLPFVIGKSIPEEYHVFSASPVATQKSYPSDPPE